MRLYLLLALLLLTGCGVCIDGSGKVVTKDDYVVSYFDSVDLAGQGDVYLVQGDKNSVKVEAEDNIVSGLELDVVGRKLIIGQKACFRNTVPVRIFVTMNDVKSLSISGSGSFFSSGEVSSPDLALDISGSGDMHLDALRVQKLSSSVSGSGDLVLKGSADRHSFSVSGSGNLRADSLRNAVTSVDISGSGNAYVLGGQELSVKVSGSGDVFYSGSPVVDKTISGSGKVEKLQ